MKMMNKTTLATALAVAMGLYLPEAAAIIKLGDTTSGPKILTANVAADGGVVVFAAEESGESTLTVKSVYAGAGGNAAWLDGDLSVRFAVPQNYVVVGSKTLFVRVTLTGGAKFAAEPRLVCPNKAAGGAFVDIGKGDAVALLASAGKTQPEILASKALLLKSNPAALGKNVAVFNFVSGFTTQVNSGCLLTFNSAGAQAGAVASAAYSITTRGDIGMTIEEGYIQGAVATTSIVSGVFMTFKTALKAVITASEAVAAGAITPKVTIDVKQASKKFYTDVGTTTTQAVIGGVKVVSAYDSAKLRLSNASGFANIAALAPRIMTTATLTIAGAPLVGLKTVGLYGLTICDDQSTVSPVAPSTTTGGSNVVLSNIPIASAVAGLGICVTVDGTTTLNNGQLTAVLTGGGVDKIVPDLGAEANLAPIGINGARVRVLNIPATTNKDQAFIRFYNTSGQDAVVRGSLYGQDGKLLGTDNVMLFNPLKANSVGVLNSATLASLVGGGTAVAPWTGRAWLLVQAELDKDSFKVVGLSRTASGVLVNLSTDASN